jgi:peptide/nickel transport system permease protein
MPRLVTELAKDRLALIGLFTIILLVAVAVAAPLLAPYDPVALDLTNRLAPPCFQHPMGTDSVGRDILSRIIFGTRVSLSVTTIVVLIELAIGLVVGTAAGYLGRTTDEILMRLVDVLLAFPGIILALVIVGMLGPSLLNLIIALAAVGWTRYARLVRGTILAVKGERFVEASRAIGCSRLWIILRHILPHILSPVIVLATLNMGSIIISIAGLSFLGLGAQPPTAEWGIMLNQGKPFMESAPHLMIFPGLMIMITVLAFNFFGDGFRDALDTRLKEAVDV